MYDVWAVGLLSIALIRHYLDVSPTHWKPSSVEKFLKCLTKGLKAEHTLTKVKAMTNLGYCFLP